MLTIQYTASAIRDLAKLPLALQRRLTAKLNKYAQRQGGVTRKLKGEKKESKEGRRPAETQKKSRRWFKGLGQIAQGSAFSIANVALAVGALKFPVSPETQTWGAVASVSTGVCTVLSGIGDLRNE